MTYFKNFFEKLTATTLDSIAYRLVLLLILLFIGMNVDNIKKPLLVIIVLFVLFVLLGIIVSILKINSSKEYFFIIEENYEMYLRKRERKLKKLFIFGTLFSLLLYNELIIIGNLVDIKIDTITIFLITILLCYSLLFVLFLQFNIYCYHLICLMLLFFYISPIRNFVFWKIVFLILVFVFYSIIVSFLSLSELRKIKSVDLLVGFLITMIIPIFSSDLVNMMVKERTYGDFYLNKERIKIIEEIHPSLSIVDKLNIEIARDIFQVIENIQLENLANDLSVMNVTIYAISILSINLKIQRGSRKAEKKYKIILNNKKHNRKISYELLRDCCYYGGEEYIRKITKDVNFKREIECFEKNNKNINNKKE